MTLRDEVQRVADLRAKGYTWNAVTERTGRTYGWFYPLARRFRIRAPKRQRGTR